MPASAGHGRLPAAETSSLTNTRYYLTRAYAREPRARLLEEFTKMSLEMIMTETAIHVSNVAGQLGGDGANGAIGSLVNNIMGAISFIVVAIFTVRALMSFAKSDKGAQGHKDLAHIGGQFVLVMALIAGAWGLVAIAQRLAGGAFH